MASKGKEKEQPPLALSLDDLDLKPNDARLLQATSCIRIYQAQAIRLTRAQQEEMCDYIKNHDYVKARSAQTASAHKLYKQTMNALKKKGRRVENLSWPIYLILSAVYKKLPKRYIKLVRRLYGSSTIGDYSNTYRILIRRSDSSPSANAANSSQNPFAPAALTPFAAPAGSTMFPSSQNAPTASTPFAAPAGSTMFPSSQNAPTASTPFAAPAGSTMFPSFKNAPTGSTPFAAPAGSTLFSSSKNAPAALPPFAAPAGSTMFSSSKNAPAASTNSFSSAVNAPSSLARLLVPNNASDQSKDTVLAAAKKTVAEAKAYMAAQKAIEDQRMSGPALQDDEQDSTGEEDSDSSSSSEVEVIWHKKRQASVNREDDPCFAAKRPRPSCGKIFDIITESTGMKQSQPGQSHQSAPEGCNCFAKLQEDIAALRTENAARDKKFNEFVQMFRAYKTESRVFMAMASGATYTPSESDAPEVWQKLLRDKNNIS